MSFAYACAIVAAMVGAGFASGREIVEFFGEFGINGYLGAIVAASIIGLASVRIMKLCQRFHATGVPELADRILGQRCKSMHVLFAGLGLVMTASMTAGVGELFALGINIFYARELGIALTAIAAIMCAAKGVSAMAGAGIVTLVAVVAYYAALMCNAPVWELRTPEYGATFMGGLYACMNVAMASGALAPVALKLDRTQIVQTGRWVVGIMFALMILALSAMLSHWDVCRNAALPTVVLSASFGYAGYYATLVVMWAAMFTTLVAAQSALIAQCHALNLAGWRVYAGLFLISILLGTLGFENIISHIYPITGVACAVAIIWLTVRARHGRG